MKEYSKGIYVKFKPEEVEMIHDRMKEAGVQNMSAFIRKMVLNGYMIIPEWPELKGVLSLHSRISNNLNQYAKKANETGNIYREDIAELKEIDEDSERQAKELLVKLAEYKPLAKIEELEEQNYNMIDDRLNNGVEKFNREEEKKEQQEKPQARSSLKERLAAKQKEVAQGNNKDTKEQEKSKNSHREM